MMDPGRGGRTTASGDGHPGIVRRAGAEGHAPTVGAVAQVGITRGCSSDGPASCPGDTVTRAQMASFLARALDLEDR